MTAQEAIFILDGFDLRNNADKYDNEALNMAQEALEKRIPKKPQPSDGYEGKCKCGAMFLDHSTNYCGNCGQRLDWSEKD